MKCIISNEIGYFIWCGMRETEPCGKCAQTSVQNVTLKFDIYFFLFRYFIERIVFALVVPACRIEQEHIQILFQKIM